MTNFENLYFVSHQPGTAGDSLVAFLSLHNKAASFDIVGHRMRSSTPGILLNWGYYYKNWASQKQDPNLYKSIDLRPGVSNFAQAHFFLQEHQLLEKFPGCKVIQILVNNPDNFDTYWYWLYQKLLNKRMHRAWHDRYLKFARLRDTNTQSTLANMCQQGILKIKHYWSAWYIDNLGMDLNLVPNPFEYWATRRYVEDFHPNKNSMLINNSAAKSAADCSNIIKINIDELWPVNGTQMNIDLYHNLCSQVGLTPDYKLVSKFWPWWKNQQPVLTDNIDYKWL